MQRSGDDTGLCQEIDDCRSLPVTKAACKFFLIPAKWFQPESGENFQSDFAKKKFQLTICCWPGTLRPRSRLGQSQTVREYPAGEDTDRYLRPDWSQTDLEL